MIRIACFGTLVDAIEAPPTLRWDASGATDASSRLRASVDFTSAGYRILLNPLGVRLRIAMGRERNSLSVSERRSGHERHVRRNITTLYFGKLM